MANFEMPVTEYMTSPVETIRIGESLVAANASFEAHRVSALGVVNDEGELKGVISRTDILHAAISMRGQAFRVPDRPVEELMQSPVIRVEPEDRQVLNARLVAPNHRGPGPVRVDSIDVGVLCLEAVGHLLEDVRELLVGDGWRPRFHRRIKPADRSGRKSARTPPSTSVKRSSPRRGASRALSHHWRQGPWRATRRPAV